MEGAEYGGGYHQYSGGCKYGGGLSSSTVEGYHSVRWRVRSTVEAIISTVEGYLKYSDGGLEVASSANRPFSYSNKNLITERKLRKMESSINLR